MKARLRIRKRLVGWTVEPLGTISESVYLNLVPPQTSFLEPPIFWRLHREAGVERALRWIRRGTATEGEAVVCQLRESEEVQ